MINLHTYNAQLPNFYVNISSQIVTLQLKHHVM